jgi:drug/metabolite transporter (DMT)-like permease
MSHEKPAFDKAAGYLCILASAVIFGFTPVLAAISYSGGNNGVNMAFLRALLPLPILFLLARREPAAEKGQWRNGIVPGILLSSCTLMLYSSYTYLSPGLATTLHFLYPLYVVLFETLAEKKPLSPGKGLGLVLGLAGALMFLEGGGGGDLRGYVLALLSGMCYAAYIVSLNREARHPLPLYRLMLTVSLMGVVVCGIAGGALGKCTFALTPPAWLCAVCVALLVAVGACVLFQRGVRTVGQSDAAIFSLLEPITSIIFSVLLMNDKLSPTKLLGCVLILSGLAVTTFEKSLKAKPTPMR